MNLMLLMLVEDCEVLRRERDQARRRVEELERALAELTLEALEEPERVWN